MNGFAVLCVVDADTALHTRHAFIVLSSAAGNELPPDLLSLMERHHIPVFAKSRPPDELMAAVAAAVERLEGSGRQELGRPHGQTAR
jgi:hypothetical protein